MDELQSLWIVLADSGDKSDVILFEGNSDGKMEMEEAGRDGRKKFS